MAVSAKDVRCTVRRVGDGDPMLYPRLLKDRSILASIDVATQYFETMVGEQRRALDPEALVHFFGDYKVARGMVASLGRVYRYRAPTLDELVTRTAARRLSRAGCDRPAALRALLWDAANEDGAGFLEGARRRQAVTDMEGRLGLRAGELDDLLYVDAPEHAILTRLGARPAPADVLAEYRRAAVAALLAQSERVELTLRRTAAVDLDAVRALAEVERIDADLVAEQGGGARVAARGQADALGSWTRQGRRVARFVGRLLERSGSLVDDGLATVNLRGRHARLRLTGEVLEALAPGTRPADGWDAVPGWDDAALAEALRRGRGTSLGGDGWIVRRQPEARAWAAGALAPDLLVRRVGGDGLAGALVCFVRTEAQAARLAGLVPASPGGEALLFVGPAALVRTLGADAWIVAQDQPALGPIVEAVAAEGRALLALRAEQGTAAGRRRKRVA